MCTYEHWGITKTMPCMVAKPYEDYKQELLYPWHLWGVVVVLVAVGAVLTWIYTSRDRDHSAESGFEHPHS